MKTIVVLISGNGSNLQTVIDGIHLGDSPGSIAAVISDRADAHGLVRAQRAEIATRVVPRAPGSSSQDYDRQLLAAVAPYAPDLIVLAGFMRVLSSVFIARYRGQIINIHPSLLPQFKGLNTHQRALDAKVQWHGASTHFVVEALDGGPVIAQARVAITPADDSASLRLKVLQQEHIILPQTIAWYCSDNLCMRDDRAYLHGEEIRI